MGRASAIVVLAAACALQIVAGACLAGAAQAEDATASYPAFPVKIVVPYPAGSIPDTLGRMIGDQLQTQFGKPVVVENRAGASTLLGAKLVSSAAPDGYTLLIPTVTTFSIAPQLNPKTGVDPINDFTPIARLGATNFFLVVRASFPAKTVREWIDEVKRNPGKYRYASAGIGTPHHIFMELLKKQFGLDITHVPYKGSVEAMPDLLAGRVDMAFLDGSQAVSQYQERRVAGARHLDGQADRPGRRGAADRSDRAGLRLVRLDHDGQTARHAETGRGPHRNASGRTSGYAAVRGRPAQRADGSDADPDAGSNRRLCARRIRALETRDQAFRCRRRMMPDFSQLPGSIS
jgi:tripartite-type tricarboxylate transporter receptor subunit TctC